MALKQISFKTPDEASVLFDRLYNLALENNATLTKGAFFEEMVNGFANPKTKEIQVENPEVLTRLKETEALSLELAERLQKADDELMANLEASKNEFNFLLELREMLNLKFDANGPDIIMEVRATQQRAMNGLSEQRPLAENEILFTIPEMHLKLLSETVKRLTEKYAKNVTMKDVLLDMFIRYTIEQYNEWFYPFVINGDADFKDITGLTQKQLKECLKKA